MMLKKDAVLLLWWSVASTNAFSFQPRTWFANHLANNNNNNKAFRNAAGSAGVVIAPAISIPATPVNAASTSSSSPWDGLEQKLFYGDSSSNAAASTASSRLADVATRVQPPPAAVETSSSTSTAELLSELLKREAANALAASSSDVTTTAAVSAVVAAPPVPEAAASLSVPILEQTMSSATASAPPAAAAAVSSSSSFLDQTAANAQSVLDSVRELSSFRAEPVATDPAAAIEYVRTLQQQQTEAMAATGSSVSLDQLEDTVRHLLQGAPPGEGISKPIVDYVMNTLYELRDSPYNPPNFFHNDGLSGTFVTTPSGFQVKQHFIQALADTRFTVIDSTKSQWSDVEKVIADRLTTSYENTEPVRSSLLSAVQTSLATTESNIGGAIERVATAYAPLRSQIVETVQTTPAVVVRQYEALASSSKPTTAAPILDAWKVSIDQLAMVQNDMQKLLRTPGWRPEDVLATLNMQELGPFYVGVALAMLLAVSYTTQRLATVAATEPSATIPDGAVTAKTFSKSKAAPQATTPGGGGGMGGEQSQLENIVADLTQATAILATEMKGMAAELRQLKQQQQPQPILATGPAMAFQSPPISVVKATTLSAPAAATTIAMDQAEDELAQMLRGLEVQNELLRLQLNTAQFESDTLSGISEALAVGAEALASIKEPVVPQNFPSLEDLGLSEAYFVAGAAAVNGNYGQQQQAQMQPVMAATSPSLMKTAVLEAPDWSNLSLAALKRKTEDELKEYLTSKGLLQGNKKNLKKADLLALVMDIA